MILWELWICDQDGWKMVFQHEKMWAVQNEALRWPGQLIDIVCETKETA